MNERGDLKLTSLEKAVEKALEQLSVEYFRQYSTRTGFVIDYALPAYSIALEVDGPWHDTQERRKRDRFRDCQLEREGWHTARIHWKGIDGHLVDKLEAVLLEARRGKVRTGWVRPGLAR